MQMKTRMQNQKGFTLIEVMIVIVILGILAAVAVPNIVGKIEDTKRRADAMSAMELANILDRAFSSGVIIFPNNTNYSVNVNGKSVNAGISVAVFVNKNGTNYYRGSGSVLVDGGDWNSDNGVAYRRIQKLFEDAGFTDVKVRASAKNGGWECFGAALFDKGVIKIFSSSEPSNCSTTTVGGNYEAVLHKALNGDNPIQPYLTGQYAN